MLFFSVSLVPTVRKALCDPLEEVREAAAKTFEQLHSTIGHQALEDILPFLLKQLVSVIQTLENRIVRNLTVGQGLEILSRD